MAKMDPRIDAYIGRSAEFARPILSRIRTVVHATCPDVEETLKWGMPTFMYHGIMCGMAAIQAACDLRVLEEQPDPRQERFARRRGDGSVRAPLFGQGPAGERAPCRLHQEGHGVECSWRQGRTPEDETQAATENAAGPARGARQEREGAAQPGRHSAPSKQREYVEWITEAKTDPTRKKRIATSVGWIAEGKSRNWKYLDC